MLKSFYIFILALFIFIFSGNLSLIAETTQEDSAIVIDEDTTLSEVEEVEATENIDGEEVIEEKKKTGFPITPYADSQDYEILKDRSDTVNASIANTIDQNYSYILDSQITPDIQRDIAQNPYNYVIIYLNPETSILIKLFVNNSPEASARFKRLVETNFYDNMEIFRLFPDYFVQAGDPTNSGYGGSGDIAAASINPDLKFDRGTVAFSNIGNLNSDDSQFFITFNSFEWLDGKYSVIGQVISGIEHLEGLQGSYNNDGFLDNPIRIFSISLLSEDPVPEMIENLSPKGFIPVVTQADEALKQEEIKKEQEKETTKSEKKSSRGSFSNAK